MKKIKLNGKLSLNKETIAKLNDNQMSDVKGGATDTCGNTTNCTQGIEPTCTAWPQWNPTCLVATCYCNG